MTRSRKAFESWKGRDYGPEWFAAGADGKYLKDEIQQSWRDWQAAVFWADCAQVPTTERLASAGRGYQD